MNGKRWGWLWGILLALLLFPSPVRAAKKTVILMDGDFVYQKVKVAKDSLFQADALADRSDATFLGWSATQGKTCDPGVEAEQYFRVDKSYTLYSVYYPTAKEPKLSVSKIAGLDTKKYKELILVGDSRFTRMKSALTAKVAAEKKALFYAVAGRTLDGFLGSGAYNEAALIARVKKKSSAKKPIAIVFELGVNDLRTGYSEKAAAKRYLAYLAELRKKLSAYNVKLFYMSVGPVSGINTRGRSPAGIRLFNKEMQKGCQAAGWQYLDLYSWMMKNGFSSYSIFDGLHYATRTSRRVFDTLVRMVNAM